MKHGASYTQALEKAEIAEIQALERKNNQQKNIFYKLDPTALAGNDPGMGHILYYDHGVLAGYMTADHSNDSKEIESASIVEDAAVFEAMHARLLREAGTIGAERILFITDRRDAFTAGLIGNFGRYTFTEYRMYLDESQFQPATHNRLVLRDAVEGDRPALVRLNTISFSQDPSQEEEISDYELARTKIAVLDNEVVGKIRIDEGDGVFGIYGFVVDPSRRGQGLGREILTRTLADMDAHQTIYLEVSPDNTPALRLYESVGFYTKTTFDYYECVSIQA